MRDAFLQYWRGILLTALGAAATIWLALSGQLGLYIHPRYFVFTAVMSGIAAIFVIVALLLPRQRDEPHDADHEHDHDHDHDHEGTPAAAPRPWRGRLAAAASALLVVAVAAALLALPPTVLSTSLAGGRDLNAAGVIREDAVQLAQADPASFSVKDWAVLIADGAAAPLEAAEPTLVGFVIADPDAPESAFAVARYVMTCCAVDAQPVGVTVELPGWQQQFADGAWVEVRGRFADDGDGWVLVADEATPVAQPAEPYVY